MTDDQLLPRRTFLQAAGIAAPAISAMAACGFGDSAVAAEQPTASATDSGQGVTRLLAEFVVNSRPADIPEPARKEAVRSVVNYVGCAVGGSRHETVQCALEALLPFSGPAQGSIFGRRERMDLLHAALMNGISSHVLDFDDTQLSTIIHPAGPVCSMLFPLAEQRGLSGAEFMHAFILGTEVECRIGKAVYPAHYDAGWHITGTAGVFGAAAAAARVLGLNVQQTVWAFGIAATQSSGFREMFGTMCKSFHPGRAAQNGLLAALLAQKNFTSSEQGIEARRSFAFVMSPQRDFSAITRQLGQSYEIVENTYKPFACGVVIHPIIDGCRQLRNEHKLTGDMIERIDLAVHPLVLELTGKTSPQTGLEGKFSVYHAAAVAIVLDSASPREFTDEIVRRPDVIAVRDRVRATIDKSLAEDQTRVSIVLKDGRRFDKFIEHAVGSRENPVSDADLDRKFRSLAEGVLPQQQTERLLAMCRSIESQKNAGDVARAAAGV